MLKEESLALTARFQPEPADFHDGTDADYEVDRPPRPLSHARHGFEGGHKAEQAEAGHDHKGQRPKQAAGKGHRQQFAPGTVSGRC